MFLTRVCEALAEAKVPYAIVGGYAVALHGAVRGTVDLDLVIALNEESFARAQHALEKLGLQSRLPVDARQVFRFREEYVRNRNLIAWSFYDPVHPADQLDIIITHDAAKMKVKTITVQGVKVRIASIESLIRMKEKAGRDQDREDVRALRKLLKNEKEPSGHEDR